MDIALQEAADLPTYPFPTCPLRAGYARLLGLCPKTNLFVFVRSGLYGPYVQRGTEYDPGFKRQALARVRACVLASCIVCANSCVERLAAVGCFCFCGCGVRVRLFQRERQRVLARVCAVVELSLGQPGSRPCCARVPQRPGRQSGHRFGGGDGATCLELPLSPCCAGAACWCWSFPHGMGI